MDSSRKKYISIFVVWLFTISGVLGILMGYKQWFLSLTWLNLLVYFLIILWNADFNKTVLLALCIPFGIGMVTEFLGANYGLIFGAYDYGENLGPKVLGVPWTIGLNWAILTYCSAGIVKKLQSNLWISSVLGSILMVFLDLIIEVSAPKFDFWKFEEEIVPLQNYVGWFFVALLAHVLLQRSIKVFHFTVSLHIFIAILFFFSVFLFV
ncbi:carotenoid biosynthesis protein [Aquimarina sp. U1-2]|uniref:carotenoid biosynthesis protein n=1 Tax=Aquimarina sp. U1-2 TaxID=2823141 RepID=UPI001AECB7D7|nr:carotenoid biosynthesis protein [Aquimarina sp. U1-2]MBP2833140.1 carotenoid biosynthesis protein [Aquimarina sp. U1-2]